MLDSRYTVEKLLGDGAFGRVLLARDNIDDRKVAVKVTKDVDRYRENAKVEAQILEDICKADSNSTSGCVVMYATFVHLGRYFCMVCEQLGDSLYDFLRWNGYRGYWLQDVQSFARQALCALDFIHGLSLTHTDLKPENILLKTIELAEISSFPRVDFQPPSEAYRTLPYMRPASNAIKLIDFGNATYIDMHHSSVINTRQYRAPEVILEIGWGEKSDLWSLGCILMELYTGHVLFDTHQSLEQLALMEQILAPFPASLLTRSGRKAKKKFLSPMCDSLRWPESAASEESVLHVCRQWQVSQQAAVEHQSFVELIRLLLTAEPGQRPEASEAMRHSFFSETFSE